MGSSATCTPTSLLCAARLVRRIGHETLSNSWNACPKSSMAEPSPPPPPARPTSTEPCYTVDAAHNLQFPDWHDACPSSLVPMPSRCTPSCAAVYAPWYARCSTDTFISNIDSQLNGAFTQWAEVCRRGN